MYDLCEGNNRDVACVCKTPRKAQGNKIIYEDVIKHIRFLEIILSTAMYMATTCCIFQNKK